MLHSRLLALVFALVVASPAEAVVVEMWEMGDGVSLHTRIYAPGDDLTTPRPVLLVRTPYGAAAAADGHIFDLLRTDAAVVNDFGIVYVTQDMRGTGASEGGATVRFIDDAPDTEDTLAAIRAAPWSNGRVSMWGPSALGIASTLALQHDDTDLKGIMPLIATGDVRDAFYPGGALREEMAVGWLPDNAGEGVLELFRAEERDSAFYDDGRLSDDEIAASSVKSLTIAGMFDVFARGSVRTFERLRALSANKDEHFLVLGPWSHDSVLPARGADIAGAFVGDVKLPLSAFVFYGQPIDPLTHFQAFLSWSLHDGGAPGFARVRAWRFTLLDVPELLTNIRVQGAWAGYTDWPPPERVVTPLYLYDDGGLGTVVDALGVARQVIADPSDPVPTIGGSRLITTGGGENVSGPRAQNALLARDDVLVFETPPASATLGITGDVRAEIWAASSRDDIDVHVKLAQKTPDGLVMLLCEGMRRGRFVDDETALTPLVPGAPVKFVIELCPLAADVRPGHALVVMIQPSNHDLHDVNPHTATPMVSVPAPRRAALTVFTDAAHPSAILLPLTAGTPPSSPVPTTHPDAPDPLWPEGDVDGGAGDGDGDGDGDDDDGDDDDGDDDGGGGGAAPATCACTTTPHAPPGLALVGVLALVVVSRRARRAQ